MGDSFQILRELEVWPRGEAVIWLAGAGAVGGSVTGEECGAKSGGGGGNDIVKRIITDVERLGGCDVAIRQSMSY